MRIAQYVPMAQTSASIDTCSNATATFLSISTAVLHVASFAILQALLPPEGASVVDGRRDDGRRDGAVAGALIISPVCPAAQSTQCLQSGPSARHIATVH
jgi:hypothetical protein